MRKRTAAAAITALFLSLGLALAGPAADKHPELDKLKDANVPMKMFWKQHEMSKVFDALEKASGVTMNLGEGFPAKTRVTLELGDVTLKEALSELAERYGLTYEVVDPTTLLVKGAVPK